MKSLKTTLAVLAASILFVPTTPALASNPEVRVNVRNFRQDPNISRRAWGATSWYSGNQVLHGVAANGRIELRPVNTSRSSPARQQVWIECDGKPWEVWYKGVRYSFTRTQEELCTNLYGRTVVPDISNRSYYNRTLDSCLNYARRKSDTRDGMIREVNGCFKWNGLNPIPLDMGLAPALTNT